MDLNKIYNCDCIDGLKEMSDNSVDLIVTSPPYDDLRKYGEDESRWTFDKFKEISTELYRVLKKGGVMVWVVGDQVKNGGETGTSFRQALHFMDIGFKLHDTMIYEKNSSSFPARRDGKRYTQIFEYMFVFVKGKIRDDIKLIADKRNKWSGWTSWGKQTQYDDEKKIEMAKTINPVPEFSLRTNIWKYNVSFNDKTKHPAVFPEKMVEDHIVSWTNEGDVVLDPFMGSGTTAKMCKLLNRNYIGFEVNKDYFEESLTRIAKHEGKSIVDQFAETEVEGESLSYKEDDEEVIAEKSKLFAKLIEDLNTYFNEQSLQTLKTLKLTFESKANTKKVEKMKNKPLNGLDIKVNEYVDLGLPSGTLWAKCNVGATKPEEYGDYFMWGSTKPDNDKPCDWAHAPLNNDSRSFNSTYFNAYKSEWLDGDVLKLEYDAAHVNMGVAWRMPTQDDFFELVEHTNNEWVFDYEGSGVNGYLFVSKVNGNTLFIPASGNRWNKSTDGRGDFADLWSSSLLADCPRNAWRFYFFLDGKSPDLSVVDRCCGCCVRGVI